MQQRDKRIDKYAKYYIISVIFIFSIVYLSIILSGKMYMFIDIGADTYCSYWPSIAYVKDLLSDMKLWDMKLGLGASTVTYISYFLLDPFNWICFFFDKENIDKGIFIGLVLKNICVAYYAYVYIAKMKIYNYSRVICSLMIVFSGWFVGWGQHYNFASVYVCFIAILYYLELWIQENKYIGIVFSTMILAMISPYYCYMAMLFIVCYYFVRIYFLSHDKKLVGKEILLHSIKTAVYFGLGLGCSAIIFLPYMSDTLSSPRVSGKIWPSLMLGSVKEYLSIIFRMYSNIILGVNENFTGIGNFYECPFMYIGILAVLILPLLLIENKLRKKYWLPIILTLSSFILINFSAPIFNAFSTKSYRWTYLFVPILAVACGKSLEKYGTKLSKKLVVMQAFISDTLMIGYYIWYFQNYEINQRFAVYFGMILVLINLYAAVMVINKNQQQMFKMLYILITVDLCINAYSTVHERSLILQESKNTMDYFDGSNGAINYLNSIDESFYRIQKKYGQIDLNDSMFQNYKGEKLYSSILSDEMWKMMDLFDLRVKNSNYFYGFDDKQILRNITVGKYRFSKTPEEYYGYKLLNIVDGIYIYENENALEFGVLYDSYVERSDVDSLDSIQLQNVLLNNCIMESNESDENIKRFENKNEIEELQYELIDENIIKDNENYNIAIENKKKKPLIIEIEGKEANGVLDIYTDQTEGEVADSISYNIEDGVKRYYIDNLNVNMLTLNNNQGRVNAIRIYELKSDTINESLNKIRQNKFHITYFSDTHIKGYTELEKEKILFLPIAYNSNWKVSINGNYTKVYKADEGFMAVVVPEGYSEIVITYNVNVFWLGLIISIISVIIVVLMAVKSRKIDRTGNL